MSIPLKTSLYIIIISAMLTLAIKLNHIPNHFAPKTVPNDYVSVFSKIYEDGIWGGDSGLGSSPSNAAEYINLLQSYIDDPRVHTIVDLGCGDWRIMSQITIPKGKTYIGYDVVPKLIEANKQKYAKLNVHFYAIKDLHELKSKNVKADLLVVKDVMQHWPNSEVSYFIKDILPNFKLALITNGYSSTPSTGSKLNGDIKLGHYRPLDLTGSPFNLQHVTTALEYEGPDPKRVLVYVNPSHKPGEIVDSEAPFNP